MRAWQGALALLLTLWGGGTAGAEDITVQANASTETRSGAPWTKLAAVVETTTDLSLARVLSVVTDWSAYPAIFSRVHAISPRQDGPDVLLDETTVVSILGFSVTNRFTLRVTMTTNPDTGVVTIRWTQDKTDGTIEGLEGGWDLVPTTVSGHPGTAIRYRNVSSVPQTFPGEDGVLSWFLPGEMKDVMTRLLAEVRQRKETS